MKKSILNLALCIAALSQLASCSTSDEMSYTEKREQAIKEMITEGMQSSEESITLMGSQISEEESRAPIYNNDDNTGKYFETEKSTIGIMMLAKKVCDETIEEGRWQEYEPYNNLKVDWTSPKNAQKPEFSDIWSVYLDNVKAKADYIKDEDDKVIGTKLKMDLLSNDKRNFYPMGAYHNYWFYAYAPVRNSDKIVKKKDQVSVIFDDLNGTQDVIFGTRYPEKTDPHYTYAYSAKYFRYDENRDPVTNLPYPIELGFSHKQMMIRFHIVAGGTPIDDAMADVDRDYTGAYKVLVKSVSITNVPKAMQLILADNERPDLDGKFEPVYTNDQAKTYETKWYTMQVNKNPEPVYPDGYDADHRDKFFEDYNTEIKGTAENVPAVIPVGEMMVPVLPNLKEKPYMISLTLNVDGVDVSMLVPMRLTVGTDNTDPAYFKEGHMYDVTLKIFRPENISLNATLEPWTEATVSPFITDDGDGTFHIH